MEQVDFLIFRLFGAGLLSMILYNIRRNHSGKNKARFFFSVVILALPVVGTNMLWHIARMQISTLWSRVAVISKALYFISFALVLIALSAYAYSFITVQLPIRGRKFREVMEQIFIFVPEVLLIFTLFAEKTQTFSYACLLLYLLWLYSDNQNELISLDPLTRLNNRNEFQGYLWYKLSTPLRGRVCLIMMDMNDFKSINDTYGHVEGDFALTCVAQCLKRACGGVAGHPFLARYGGDEFLIIMETYNDDVVKHLMDCINMMLAVENHRLEKPYTLSISIGWARNEQHNRSVRKLMRRADKQLYEKKRIWKEGKKTLQYG